MEYPLPGIYCTNLSSIRLLDGLDNESSCETNAENSHAPKGSIFSRNFQVSIPDSLFYPPLTVHEWSSTDFTALVNRFWSRCNPLRDYFFDKEEIRFSRAVESRSDILIGIHVNVLRWIFQFLSHGVYPSLGKLSYRIISTRPWNIVPDRLNRYKARDAPTQLNGSYAKNCIRERHNPDKAADGKDNRNLKDRDECGDNSNGPPGIAGSSICSLLLYLDSHEGPCNNGKSVVCTITYAEPGIREAYNSNGSGWDSVRLAMIKTICDNSPFSPYHIITDYNDWAFIEILECDKNAITTQIFWRKLSDSSPSVRECLAAFLCAPKKLNCFMDLIAVVEYRRQRIREQVRFQGKKNRACHDQSHSLAFSPEASVSLPSVDDSPPSVAASSILRLPLDQKPSSPSQSANMQEFELIVDSVLRHIHIEQFTYMDITGFDYIVPSRRIVAFDLSRHLNENCRQMGVFDMLLDDVSVKCVGTIWEEGRASMNLTNVPRSSPYDHRMQCYDHPDGQFDQFDSNLQVRKCNVSSADDDKCQPTRHRLLEIQSVVLFEKLYRSSNELVREICAYTLLSHLQGSILPFLATICISDPFAPHMNCHRYPQMLGEKQRCDFNRRPGILIEYLQGFVPLRHWLKGRIGKNGSTLNENDTPLELPVPPPLNQVATVKLAVKAGLESIHRRKIGWLDVGNSVLVRTCDNSIVFVGFSHCRFNIGDMEWRHDWDMYEQTFAGFGRLNNLGNSTNSHLPSTRYTMGPNKCAHKLREPSSSTRNLRNLCEATIHCPSQIRIRPSVASKPPISISGMTVLDKRVAKRSRRSITT